VLELGGSTHLTTTGGEVQSFPILKKEKTMKIKLDKLVKAELLQADGVTKELVDLIESSERNRYLLVDAIDVQFNKYNWRKVFSATERVYDDNPLVDIYQIPKEDSDFSVKLHAALALLDIQHSIIWANGSQLFKVVEAIHRGNTDEAPSFGAEIHGDGW